MKSHLLCALFLAFGISWLLTACAPTGITPASEGTQEAVYTSAAQTLFAQLTLAAGETAVAKLTQIAQQPTATPAPPTPSTAPTATSVPPTPTPTPGRCNWAEYLQNVSVEDNSVFFPGAVLTKIWRVRNVGTCEWTSDYAMVFSGGDALGAPSAVFLPGTVPPGEQVDLSINFIAPANPGIYRGNWLLRSPTGELFGTGLAAQDPLWVQIQVAQPPVQGKGTYDFSLSFCDAVWRSDTAALGCPGFIDDPNGSVVLLNQPYLESRLENEPALWTRPNVAPRGRISGQYPSTLIRTGDRFRAEVGCLRNSSGCDVLLSLDYRTAGGTVYNLGSWRETYDGRTTLIDIDLTPLAGQSVQFLLGAQNLGDPLAANAFWFAPHIENAAPQTDLVLVWNQQGGPRNICEELRIFRTGSTSSYAQARSCKGAGQDLGSGALTDDEQQQLLDWIVQLAPFDAELFNAETGEPLTSYMTFDGIGDEEALSPHITAMQDFAQRVYRRLTR